MRIGVIECLADSPPAVNIARASAKEIEGPITDNEMDVIYP